MTLQITLNGPDSKDGITINENGIITRVSVTSHGDLLIRQHAPGREPVNLSSYSDSGFSIYALLAKFLAMRGGKHPRIAKKGFIHDWNRDFDNSEEDAAHWALMSSFPYKIHNQSIDDDSRAIISKKGGLEIEAKEKKMILSPALVHVLVEKIPEMFPHASPYRFMAAVIRRKTPRPVKGNEFRTKPPAERRSRARSKGPRHR